MKKYSKFTKNIDGTEYTAQFNGFSELLRMSDETYIPGTNVTSAYKSAAYLLANTIVDPKGLTADSFESLDTLNKVITFASDVAQGKEPDSYES